MRVLQIVLMGAAGAVVCGVLTLMAELAWLMVEVSKIQSDGGGGLGVSSMASWAPVAALVGFVLGALWQYRRTA